MTPGTVLKQYLELCSHDIGRLSYQLASNAALEWNGITVRGASKIVKFLRQKQHAGMVQSFPNVCTVDAFEQRETHIATKSTPPENLIKVASPSRAEQTASPQPASPSTSTGGGEFAPTAGDLSFETPPRTLPAAPHPPPLTGGRQFLPLSSDDDEDDDARPTSTKPAPPRPPPDEDPRQNIYSELQYLEAIGTLRTANEPKHRGTRTTHHIPREDPSADSSGGSSVTQTGAGGDYSEKRTKLKVSYRAHLLSREIQFALIIYEHISSRSSTVRRNLFVDELQQQPVDSDEESSFSPIQRRLAASPELTPLPESPPTAQPPSSAVEHESSPPTPVQPPGTPIKRRRIPPLIAGMRTSPRRSRPVDDFAIITGGSSSSGSGSSSSGVTTFNIQQTWPRKNHSTATGGGSPGSSAAKSRKLATGSSSTIRKPLRF